MTVEAASVTVLPSAKRGSARVSETALLLRGTRYLLPYKRHVIGLMAALGLQSLYEIGVRYSFKYILDAAAVRGDGHALKVIVGGIAVGAAVYAAFCVATDWAWARYGVVVINDIRRELFARLQRLPMAFFRGTATGDLHTRFTVDAAKVESGLLYSLPMGVVAAFEITVTLVLMARMSPLMCAVATGGVALCIASPRPLGRIAVDAGYALHAAEGKLGGHIQENLRAQHVVKSLGIERYAEEQFTRRLDEILDRASRAYFLSYLVARVPNVLFVLVNLVLFATGAWQVMHGRLHLDQLAAYQALFIGLDRAMSNFTTMGSYIVDALSGLRRITEVLDAPDRVLDRPDADEMPHPRGEVCFDRVRFAYDDRGDVLDGASFTVAPGEHVALTGPSGSGKSTALHLLLRFDDPRAGSVRMDGRDIREFTLRSLRANLSLVSQDIDLFDLSFRENIRLGRLDATDVDVEASARAAGIHDFIVSLPGGYDTRCGERGTALSGGQRQRVALARALVRKPAILLLDEATASLDPEVERSILDTIDALRGSCTIISVTHRPEVARRADRVLSVRAGRVSQVPRAA